MPGLDNIDPQGELVRRIHALEADLRRVSTLRRRPSPGCLLTNASNDPTYPESADTVVALNAAVYGTAGMADTANNRVIIPSAGIYLVGYRTSHIGNIPSPSDQAVTYFVRNGSTAIEQTRLWRNTFASNMVSNTLTTTAILAAGDELRLIVGRGAGGGTFTDNNADRTWTLMVERLHDIPAQD